MKYQLKSFITASLVVLLFGGGLTQAWAAVTGRYTTNEMRMTFYDASGKITDLVSGAEGIQNDEAVNGWIDFSTTNTIKGLLQSGIPFFSNDWTAGVLAIQQNDSLVDVPLQYNVTEITYTDTTTCREPTGSGYCALVGWPGNGKTPDPGTAATEIAAFDYILAPGQFALHTTFFWSTSTYIPVLMVYDYVADDTGGCLLTNPVDTGDPIGEIIDAVLILDRYAPEGNGVPGTAMVWGPFPFQNPVFSGPLIADAAAGPCAGFPPTANAATPSVLANESTVLAISGQDLDGDALTNFTPTATAMGGTLSPVTIGSTTGNLTEATITYTPPPGYVGQDSFEFTVSDGGRTSPWTAKVVITVKPNLPGIKASNFTMLDGNGEVFGGTNDVDPIYLDDAGNEVASVDDITPNTSETGVDGSHFNMAMASRTPQTFFGSVWTAHHIRVFGPGNYAFDSTCSTAALEAGTCSCSRLNNASTQVGEVGKQYTVAACDNGNPALLMNVAPGQLGAHMLFDWSTTQNIDVINVWNRDDFWGGWSGVRTDAFNKPWQQETGLAFDPEAIIGLVSTDADGNDINGARMVDGPFIGFNANFNLGPTAWIDPIIVIADEVGDTKVSEGCTISTASVSLKQRADWLVLLGFLVLLGLVGSYRRSQRTSSNIEN